MSKLKLDEVMMVGGKEIPTGDPETPAATYRWAIKVALNAMLPAERDADPLPEKMKRYFLAEKVDSAGEEMEFTAKQVTLITRLAAMVFPSPQIVAKLVLALDPAEADKYKDD